MFVPASALYDPATGTRLAHPAHEASDEALRRAIAEVDAR
jgi:hypothetical protein